MQLRASALMVAALSVQTALGQCDWFIADVPDFDQRRRDTVSVPGLPADGGMYCAPTSALNWFAYFANHGIPQPGTLDGPRDWQAPAQYDRVTDVDLLLGALMGTDATRGTRGGLVPGATLYTALFASGDVIVYGSHVWGGGAAPSPQLLADYYNLGAYLQTAYGYYGGSSGGTRGGGHVISAVGVWGCSGAPILQFRDPADDSANITQSQFRVSLAAMTKVTGMFRPKSSELFESKTLYRLDTTEPSTMFLDEFVAHLPAAALFGSGLESAGEIEIVRPVRPAGSPLPLVQRFDKPAGTGAILDAAFDPAMRWYYFVTAQGSDKSSVWRLDPLTGASIKILPAPFDPRRIAMGRFGDMYVIEGASVVRYDLSTTPATKLDSITPSPAPEAIAYNDLNDTVLILTEKPTLLSRRVLSRPRSLTGFGTDRTLPVSVSGKGFIAPDAEESGAFWVCGDGGGSIYRIAYDPGAGALVETHSASHAPATLSGLSVTDGGSVVYAVNGTLVEKVISARGVLLDKAGSRWAGRKADGSVSIARSRSNFDPAIMDGPEFDNTPDPFLFPSHPDCYADCDGSGTVDFFDFLCFQNEFA
ncbi:MAG: hypothetical protein ACF8R7_09840, partial [Phycisphaerales bacterium JB039]